MASVSMVGAGFSYSARPSPSMEALKSGRGGRSFGTQFPISSSGAARRAVVVRAETINPEIRKTEEKVVDSVPVAELAKPVTAYCRYFLILCSVWLLRNTRKTKEKKGKWYSVS